jgi:hypothetical protein
MLSKRPATRGARRVLFAAVALAASAGSSAVATCPTLFGDVTGNGATNVADVQCAIITALYQLSGAPAGLTPVCLGPLGAAGADVDCSGAATVSDAVLTASFILSGALGPAVDGNANGCPDGCEDQGEPAAPALRPTSFSGTASGGGFTLQATVPGSLGSGTAATGGGNTLRTAPAGQ